MKKKKVYRHVLSVLSAADALCRRAAGRSGKLPARLLAGDRGIGAAVNLSLMTSTSEVPAMYRPVVEENKVLVAACTPLCMRALLLIAGLSYNEIIFIVIITGTIDKIGMMHRRWVKSCARCATN